MLAFTKPNSEEQIDSNTMRVLVHVNINRVMLQISKSITNSGDEYGMHLKCYRHDDKTIVVLPDYSIPEQTVTTVTFESGEGRPDASYNAVIHRHPAGVLSFSGTDDNDLNPNFLCSLLYTVEKGVFKANVNLETNDPNHFFAVETENILVYATDNQLQAILEAEL